MSARTKLRSRALLLLLLGVLAVKPLMAVALEVNADCVDCHATTTPGKAAFGVALPDKDTACSKCHLDSLLGTHPRHNVGGNCGACHASFGDSLISNVPTVILPGGAFASAASQELPSYLIHSIHANPRWPANVKTASSKCSSCHNAAACSACHTDAADATHASHGASDPTTDSIGAPWTGTVSVGVVVSESEDTALTDQTVTCGAPGCHNTAAVAAGTPVLMDCYSHGDILSKGYVSTVGRITRTGSWSTLSGGYYSLGRSIASGSLGSFVNITFNGQQVSVFGTRGPSRGISRVLIDNIDMGSFDQYGSGVRYQQLLWTSPRLTAGEHTISVRVTGAKNPLAKATYIDFDHISVSVAAAEGVAPGCSTCHGPAHALSASFCGDCHATVNGTYAGPAVFSDTKHAANAASTVALTQYPGTGYGAGTCVNCHVSHTSTRAATNQICFDCHDGAGTAKPDTYSYRSQPTYGSSAHGSSASAQQCGACHAVHGSSDGNGGALDVGLRSREPAVCTGSLAQPGCHAQAANSASGIDVLAAFQGAAAGSHHDAFSAAAGHINCSSCHNPHIDSAATMTANPSAIGLPLPDATERFRSASGDVYALVGAAHDGIAPAVTTQNLMYGNVGTPTVRYGYWYSNEPATSVLQYGPTTAYGTDLVTRAYLSTSHSYSGLNLAVGTTWHYRIKMTDALGNTYYGPDATYRTPWTLLTTAPTVSGGSNMSTVTVTWATMGACETWVEFGPTTAYGSVEGTSAYTTSHVVNLAGLPNGSYHLRAKSVRDGDVYTSADFTVNVYPAHATAPTLTPVPSNSMIPGPQSITFNWTQPNVTYAPFTYQLHVYDPSSSPTYEYTSGWLTSTSATLTLDGDHNYLWTVQAKDKDGTIYPLQTPPGSFYLYYYSGGSGSCPFLYTWDGEKYVFEADEFAAGKLGLDTKAGYRRPNPLDYHVLSTTPATKDGALEYKLVEERREVDYLDQLKLYTLDAPSNRDVWVERSQAEGVGAFAGLRSVLHTTERDLLPPPSVTWVNTGEDVTTKVAASDREHVILNEDRNVDYNYQTLELDLGDVASAPQVKLVIDGRTFIPTTVAGRQRSLLFGAQVKFEVQDASGTWVPVPKTTAILPKPPEFTRPFVMDISDIWISDSRKVRVTYLYKTYIDSILLDTSADAPVHITEVPLVSADLQPHGYNERTSLGELYDYRYGDPASPPSYELPGYHTKFGEVSPLLGDIDDKFVIFGGGDELTLRFQTPDAPGASVNRKYLLLSDGYYKDLKQTVDKTVAPLPFAAMSNFPYTDAEHYPDDADHQAYQTEWNTRYQAQGSTAETIVASSEINVFGSLLQAARQLVDELLGAIQVALTHGAEPVKVASLGDTTYSVDTDIATLSLLYESGSTAYLPQAGWQSASSLTAKPTPTSPGTPVTSTTLNQASSANGVYWRTDLTTTNQQYNWQVTRYNVPSAALVGATALRIAWTGHGEPTVGYPVKLYLWDFIESTWVLASEGSGGSNFTLSHSERKAGPDSFCLTCHRVGPPAGAEGANAYAPIASSWDADRHGDGAGSGYGGALLAPYARGANAIACAVCHDAHGTNNLYHLVGTINGTSGITVGTGNQYQNACLACHSGTVAGFHEQCRSCHQDGVDHTWGPTIDGTSDCSACHRHGYVYVHPEVGCHGCGDPGGYAWRSF